MAKKSSSNDIKLPMPGASESSAGDDFHVLWAIRRSLDLINFKDQSLKAVTVEGATPKDTFEIDPEGDKLLAIDLGEYYGSDHFKDAELVTFSQLKYSTRLNDVPWTIAKICQGKKTKYAGSIIHRLADTYKGFLDEYGSALVEAKLTLKLVSNRPFADKSKKTITDIQSHIQSTPNVDLLKLKRAFPDYREDIERLRNASKLVNKEFIDFLKLLDFNDCGTESRFFQKQIIIQAISSFSSYESEDQYNRLHLLVWKKMMPNTINLITKEDILYCFGFSDVKDLFPVPAKFEKLSHIVEREQLSDISDEIINNTSSKPICIHGGAGIGKSTISQSIINYLPKGSYVLKFDCYGGGTYLNKSDSRHKPEWAYLQMSNELAVEIGSPLLLMRGEKSSELYIRKFKDRVKTATEILKEINPNAILVILIDAADNSITAAERKNEDGFVHDIVQEEFAEGCQLIVTTRTHRMGSLNLPSNCIKIEILPFSIEETKNYLLPHFPDITNEQIEEFRSLTKGIPRIQSYILSDETKDIDSVLSPLRPDGATMEVLIARQIQEASLKIGNENVINSFLTYLITLPRPVPFLYLKKLTSLDSNILNDLETDLWHGLVYEDGTVGFRDEDFETYVRDKYKGTIEVDKKISNLFLENADNDEYASTNLGSYLFSANELTVLKNVVLNKQYLSLPKDPVLNKEMFIERARLAMKACISEEDRVTYIKIQLIAAEAAKTDKILYEILLSHPDLTATYADIQTMKKLYQNSENSSWVGPLYLASAAVFSRTKSSHEQAKYYLESAERWIDWRNRLPEKDIHDNSVDNLNNYPISNKDIAFGMEAYFHLYGIETAAKWLKRWTPKSIYWDVVKIFVEMIFPDLTNETIEDYIQSGHARTDISILLINAGLKHNRILSVDVKQLAEKLLRISTLETLKMRVYNDIILFCEHLIFIGNDREIVKQISDKITLTIPGYIPSFYANSWGEHKEDKNIMDLCFRLKSLQSLLYETKLEVEAFYPDEVKKKLQSEDKKEVGDANERKTKLDRFYLRLLPLYQLRARLVSRDLNEPSFFNLFRDSAKNMQEYWELRHYMHDFQYALTFLAQKMLDILPFIQNKKDFISILKDTFVYDKRNHISLRLCIAERVISYNEIQKDVLIILREVDDLIQSEPLPANEKIDFYVRCSIIGNKIDHSVGKYYFDKTILAASEVDIEAHEQIKIIRTLMDLGIPSPNPVLAQRYTQFIEYCSIRLKGWDGFPWEKAIEGIALIDCSTAFATLCGWDHQYIISFTKYVKLLLDTAVDSSFINHQVASALLPLNSYYWDLYFEFVEKLVRLYDQDVDGKKKCKFFEYLIRDIELNTTSSSRHQSAILKGLNNIIGEGKYLTRTILEEIKTFSVFLNSISVEEKPSTYNYDSAYEGEDVDWNSLTSNVNINSINQIEKNLWHLESKKDDFLIKEKQTFFLQKIKEKCTPQQYVEHLDTLIQISPKIINHNFIYELLEERLQDWDVYPSVELWKKDRFERVLSNWFTDFIFSNDYIDIVGIKKLASLFSISITELATTITQILPNYIDILSSGVIYQLMELTQEGISVRENECIIDWALNHWTASIPQFPEVKQAKSFSSNETIAFTLRYLLGHPEKSLRWLAAHSIRRLIDLDSVDVLKILLEKQNERNNMPFQYEPHTFFWMSSKLWLWITILRVAYENPLAISQFVDSIVKEISEMKLPHALINQMIKDTCIELEKKVPNLFSKEELKIIYDVNINSATGIPPKRDRLRHYVRRKDDWRFNFDTLDVVPHWYEDLGDLFNLSTDFIVDLADDFIFEHWGYTGNVHKDNHVRIQSNNDYDDRVYKGSVPRIENLRNYYQFHVLFCVASGLLKTHPLCVSEYNDENWSNWLTDWSPTFPNYWLSDIRDILPLESKFWRDDIKTRNKDWANELIKDEIYDEIIGIKTNGNHFIIPYASYKIRTRIAHEDVFVTSAVVSKKTASALLRTFESSEDYYEHYIPFEEEDFDSDSLFPNFVFKGWLRCNNIEAKFDELDPLSNKIDAHSVILGSEFTEIVPVVISQDNRFATSINDNKLVSKFEKWTNVTDREYESDMKSEGARLHVQIASLLDFLKAKNYCLIIRCILSRYPDDYDYKEDSKDKDNVKTYLLHSNGEIETINRRFKIR